MIELIKDNDLKRFHTNSNAIKIDWTNLLIVEYDYLGEFGYKFPVTPENYLIFAKQGLQDKSLKGLIDAMSNAKRAIECQIDSIIFFLGYNYKTFDKRTAYPKTKEFITNYYKDETTEGITDRIKLLQILNIAPTFLISKIRSLRNKIEHEYIIPDIKDVKEAIEIAELFINSSMRKINWINRMILFGSNYKEELYERFDGSNFTHTNLYTSYMCFEIINHLNEEGKTFIKIIIIRKNNNSMPYDRHEGTNEIYLVDNESGMYPVILLIFFTKQYQLLLEILAVNIDKKHIKYFVQEA